MNKQSVFSILLGLIVLGAPGSPARSQQTVLDRIVAVVGRESILQSDLNAQLEFYSFNNHVDPATPGLKEQLLDEMINQKLMLARAIEDKIGRAHV